MKVFLLCTLLACGTLGVAQTPVSSIDEETFCKELLDLVDQADNYFEDIFGNLLDSDSSGSTPINYYGSSWSFTDLPEGYIEDYNMDYTFMVDIGSASESHNLFGSYDYLKTMIGRCLGSEWTVQNESASESVVQGVYWNIGTDLGYGTEVGLSIFKDGDWYYLQLAIYTPL